MRTQRIGRFVLEIDMGRSVEGLLQSVGTHERCRTVVGILVAHLLGNVDPRMLGVELLTGTFHAEDVSKVFGHHRLMGGRMEGRQRLVGHVGLDVIPLCGDVFLLQ